MKYAKLEGETMEAVVNKLGGMEGVQRFLRGETVVSEPLAPPLLEKVGIVTIPASAEKFVVSDRIAEIRKSGRKIYTGSNFDEWFGGMMVEPIAETQLQYHKLSRAEVDGPIIAALGGQDKAETTLAEVFALMELQKDGESGALLTNGYANIFYVKRADGLLCAVFVRWPVDGWHLYAPSVDDPRRWYEGYRAFSRNS